MFLINDNVIIPHGQDCLLLVVIVGAEVSVSAKELPDEQDLLHINLHVFFFNASLRQLM